MFEKILVNKENYITPLKLAILIVLLEIWLLILQKDYSSSSSIITINSCTAFLIFILFMNTSVVVLLIFNCFLNKYQNFVYIWSFLIALCNLTLILLLEESSLDVRLIKGYVAK